MTSGRHHLTSSQTSMLVTLSPLTALRMLRTTCFLDGMDLVESEKIALVILGLSGSESGSTPLIVEETNGDLLKLLWTARGVEGIAWDYFRQILQRNCFTNLSGNDTT